MKRTPRKTQRYTAWMLMNTIKWNRLEIRDNQAKNIKEILILNRQINSLSDKEYFSPEISDLLDPFLLPGMNAAVNRIIKALDNSERIVIFWDYDVDWVSSTALLVKFLNEIWAKVSYRLPHRANDGYWLKKHFLDDIKNNDVKLLITVDCWTRDIDEINYANELWIDVIITDHHNVPTIIPSNLIALINPKLVESKYPNRWLSWSWVAFKLLHAICFERFWKSKTELFLKKYIDFAMLGTVADCMELKWENRTIAYLWLKQIKNSHSAWLKRLIEWEDLSNVDSDIVWFKIWPRLNAAWRMDTPYKALKVLLASESNLDEAISEIESLNEKRKTSTEKFAQLANRIVDSSKNVIIFDSPDIWHWVIWLIAWRLAEAHNKLSIVLKDEGEKLVWSARWPEFIKIVELFETMSSLFDVFWWHDQAAGFTISKANYPIFKDNIERLVWDFIFNVDTTKTLICDTYIDLDQIDFDLLTFIESMQPFWIWNEKPLFISDKIRFDDIRYIWKDNKHLKFFKSGNELEFKAFKFWEYFELLNETKTFSIVFEIERNIWQSKHSISLNIKDILL